MDQDDKKKVEKDVDLAVFDASDNERSEKTATQIATTIDPALFESDDDEEELDIKDASELKLDDETESALQKKLKATVCLPILPFSHFQQASTSSNDTQRGTIYLGRIPHGFYEEQMRAYFSQFGTVTRLRLSRNKKTGRSKHYAFIEFENEEVAKIVAETMDNYLMFGHLLKCSIVPPEKIHEKLWVGANKKFRVVPWKSLHRAKFDRVLTEEELKERAEKLLEKEKMRREKIKELGLDYDFPGFVNMIYYSIFHDFVQEAAIKKKEEASSEEKTATSEKIEETTESVVVEAAEVEEVPETEEPPKKKQKKAKKSSKK